MQTLHWDHRTVAKIAGAGLALLALAGCRHMDRMETGSIKDSPAVASSQRTAAPRHVVKARAAPATARVAPARVAMAEKPTMAAAPAAATPASAPAAAKPAPKVDNRGPVEIALGEVRGMLERGDVVAARAKLESGMATARSPYLLTYARTYDAHYLGKLQKPNAAPDAAKAAALYQEAAQLGSGDAAADLKRLQKR